MSKYLEFRESRSKTGNTLVIYVFSKSSDYSLGKIKWYAKWRQYSFFPEHNTLYNRDCMIDIVNKINECKEWQINFRKDRKKQ